MILYYSKNIDSGKYFVSEKLESGVLNYPTEYEFCYLIKCELTEQQIAELKNYSWTEYLVNL